MDKNFEPKVSKMRTLCTCAQYRWATPFKLHNKALLEKDIYCSLSRQNICDHLPFKDHILQTSPCSLIWYVNLEKWTTQLAHMISAQYRKTFKHYSVGWHNPSLMTFWAKPRLAACKVVWLLMEFWLQTSSQVLFSECNKYIKKD